MTSPVVIEVRQLDLLPAKLTDRIAFGPTCWLWIGYVDRDGWRAHWRSQLHSAGPGYDDPGSPVRMTPALYATIAKRT